MLDEYLTVINRKTLDLKRFDIADIPEIYPVERINLLMNRNSDLFMSE